MALDIDDAFITQFEDEVHEAYQRMGSKLRGTVRTVNGVNGSKTTFQKVGKGAAGTKTRHGLVPTMNADHSQVEVTLTDYYAGDWVDKLDELKTNVQERQVVTNAGAYALGRKTDAILIDAIGATSNNTATGVTLTDGMTLSNALSIYEVFGNADIPEDGGRFAVVGYRQWAQLLQINEFASADYVSEQDKPYTTQLRPKEWIGFNWMPHTNAGDEGKLLTGDGTTNCLFYHSTAVGHAIGSDVETDISWHGDRASYFVNNMMSMGAVIIDENAVYELPFTDSPS